MNKLYHCTILLFCIMFIASACSRQTENQEKSNKNPFFNEFSSYGGYNAKYRVGFSTDTIFNGLVIRAITTAYFDSCRYTPQSTYIIKHTSGDLLVLNTTDAPLLSHSEFSDFYKSNMVKNGADTIIGSSFIENFCIKNDGRVEVESFQHLPFVFMDVNFDGKRELLIREKLEMYYYTVYEIGRNGLKKMETNPYKQIKNRTNQWCYGGSTEFDYDEKSITIHALSSESCSDHGVSIKLTYTLNPITNSFDLKQEEYKYD